MMIASFREQKDADPEVVAIVMSKALPGISPLPLRTWAFWKNYLLRIAFGATVILRGMK
jgi:hypothetical protein